MVLHIVREIEINNVLCMNVQLRKLSFLNSNAIGALFRSYILGDVTSVGVQDWS